jgi:hypothetical protein
MNTRPEIPYSKISVIFIALISKVKYISQK